MKRNERRRDIFSLCGQVHGLVLYVTLWTVRLSNILMINRLEGSKPYTPKKKMQFMYTRRHTNDKHNRTTCPGFLAQWGYASVSFQKNVFFVCLFICLSVQQHKGNLMHFLVCYCKQPCWKQPKEKKRERVGQCWMIWLSLSSSPWMRLCLLHACVCVVFRHQRRRNYFYIYTADESVPLCFGSVLLCFW